jgi:poly(3-hydroxybutyrate) depolymerase
MRRWSMMMAAATVLLIGPACATGAGEAPANLAAPTRTGQFAFARWDGPALPVFFALPDRVEADTQVVIVMHGVNRDADRYRDEWAGLARKHGFIAVCPQFSAADFPGALGYNTGYFTTAEGAPRPRSQWSFAAIEPLFDDVRARFGTEAARYTIYGHSAGSQFVHRYVLFTPEARIERAIAANAGWYTMPDRAVAFPYGLGETPIGADGLSAALGKPLTVLLGTADTDRADTDLRKTPEADAQGQHRFARGQSFFARGQKAAEAAGVAFGWKMELVPGIAHNNAGMAEAAARIIAAR